MKIAVLTHEKNEGSLDRLRGLLDNLTRTFQKEGKPLTIMTGDSPSDRLVQDYCKERSCDVVVFKPHHVLDSEAKFHPRLFFIRNRQLVQNADVVYLIADGELSSDLVAAKRHAEKLGTAAVVI